MNTEGIKETNNQHHIYTHSLKPEDNRASKSTFLEIFNSKAQDYVQDKRPCEYFDMEDKYGLVAYKSAVFVCNHENNTLELGDCSDERNCIRVKLSKGGSLLVNRDNIDDLLMSIGMFSAKDQGLIMAAVMKDKMAQAAKHKSEEGEEVDTLMDMVKGE